LDVGEHNRQYGTVHRATRAAVEAEVRGGTVRCARGELCKHAELVNGIWLGGFIHAGEKWDLDHRDDRKGYLGASHAACNRGAGNRTMRERLRPMRTSREWF
jgi:hypothetical protein